MNIYNVIKRPLITEKGTGLQRGSNKYFFEVDRKATKFDVKNAVEAVFKVQVTDVNTISMPHKPKRLGQRAGIRQPWKKACVTLKEGDRIEYAEGA